MSDESKEGATLGVRENLDLDVSSTATVPVSSLVASDGVMRTDGTTNSTNQYEPYRVETQTKMRYQSLLSHALRIVVPYNLKLEAGHIVHLTLIKSAQTGSQNEGGDEYQSGLYIAVSYTHLTLPTILLV